MQIISHDKFLDHDPKNEIEGAYRLLGLTIENKDTDLNTEELFERITAVHSKRYLNKIRVACKGNHNLAEIQLSPHSYEAALLAVQLSILASTHNDFAFIRPPGHHASKDNAAGFCLFNNIAIACKKLLNEGKRVFILDIDGHHGNGTQSIFYNSNQAYFCSIHQMPAYPGTGYQEERRRGTGKGYNLNIPLAPGSGDAEFMDAVLIALKVAEKFKPDVFAVSAGFDGYKEDKLLDLSYSLSAFYQCGFEISKRFDNVFAILEGGYHDRILDCVNNFVSGINSKENPK